MTTDFHSVARAARKTRPRIEIQTPDAGAVMAFDVEVGVGEPGQVRPLMTVKGPGMHTFPKNIEAGQLVSVRYPGGHPGDKVNATIHWDYPSS